MILPESFYLGEDVLGIAQELIGKSLFVFSPGGDKLSGRIVEVEAYNGEIDRASHAFGGRRTKRTETMYLPGGHAYTYLCYGVHHLFNVVTGPAETPHAVLIRGIEIEGDESGTLGRGPGKLSKTLGITTETDGWKLDGKWIGIFEHEHEHERGQGQEVFATPRIGVDYAGEDASLLYRFFTPSRAISGKSALNKSAVRVK